MTGWIAIDEEYPQPNERVLIATEEGEIGVGIWEPDAGWIMEYEGEEGDCEPTHWMRLPPLPQ